MIGRVGPVGGMGNQAVFDGIEVYVVHMGRKIEFVASHVFPEAALPDAALVFGGSGNVSGSSCGSDQENGRFMVAQRVEKSASSSGRVQTA